MAFKENILKKIKIQTLAKIVLASIGPLDSGLKVDRSAMRLLLELGGFKTESIRDLELFILSEEGETKKILVLDNELPIYQTTIDDVVLRKSPIIKEMVNIKNAIKILRDSDVLVSKKEISVMAVRDACIAMLDLHYSRSDLEKIAEEGQTALKIGDADGVVECLEIFAELSGYQAAPAKLQFADHKVYCLSRKDAAGVMTYGPFIFYSLTYNTLSLLDESFDIKSKQKDNIRQVIIGNDKPTKEGSAVIDFLSASVTDK